MKEVDSIVDLALVIENFSRLENNLLHVETYFLSDFLGEIKIEELVHREDSTIEFSFDLIS